MSDFNNKVVAPISVIIPVYNCENYLEETVNSVLAQPLKVMDIILINDGSTDSSGSLCETLAQKHNCIHVIHQKNAGVSVARNAGIEYVLTYSDSTYMMFLDSDDCWQKDWLTDAVVELLHEGHDTVAFDAAHTNHALTRRNITGHMFTGVMNGGDQAVAADHQHFGATAFRCDFMCTSSIRFHEGQKWAEDTIFIQETRSLAQTCCFVEKLVYLYRNRPGSAIKSRINAIGYYTTLFDEWIKTQHFLGEHGFTGTTSPGAIKWYMNDMCIEHFREYGSRAELLDAIAEYADYLELDDHLSPTEKAHKYLERYSRRYEYKQRLLGTILRAARRLSRIPVVGFIRDIRRYNIPIEM